MTARWTAPLFSHITPSQYDSIRAYSIEAGISVSEYTRRLIQQHIIAVRLGRSTPLAIFPTTDTNTERQD